MSWHWAGAAVSYHFWALAPASCGIAEMSRGSLKFIEVNHRENK
jgi:hypothetical protein